MMFTCPEQDIHSVYLDGELPQVYVREYEAHVASCKKCRDLQSRLIKLGSTLKTEKASLDFSDEYKNKSFDRLLSQLSYSKVAEYSRKKNRVFSFVRYGAVAAAAAFAVFFALPSVVRNSTADSLSRFTPVSNAKLLSPSNQGIVVDGALSAQNVVSLFGENSSHAASQTVSAASPVGNLSRTSSKARPELANYDIFMGYPKEKSYIPSFERYKSSNFHYYSSVPCITIDMDK